MGGNGGIGQAFILCFFKLESIGDRGSVRASYPAVPGLNLAAGKRVIFRESAVLSCFWRRLGKILEKLRTCGNAN